MTATLKQLEIAASDLMTMRNNVLAELARGVAIDPEKRARLRGYADGLDQAYERVAETVVVCA